MVTPLIIVSLLVVPLLATLLLRRAGHLRVDWRIGGIVGLSLAFFFFATGHFAMTQPLVEMLPPWVPQRSALVYATGVLEVLIGVALLVPATRRIGGWAAAAVLVLFFPANVYAAIHQVGPGGHAWGLEYLWLRAPLQLLLLAWVYAFALRGRPLFANRKGAPRRAVL